MKNEMQEYKDAAMKRKGRIAEQKKLLEDLRKQRQETSERVYALKTEFEEVTVREHQTLHGEGGIGSLYIANHMLREVPFVIGWDGAARS